ncbi:MAG: hypothetical protein KAI43_02360 [Candidatus Aureabacteria bacterium]|nr:hypothetical protein [Candidatus Auribacterota bacterium]
MSNDSKKYDNAIAFRQALESRIKKIASDYLLKSHNEYEVFDVKNEPYSKRLQYIANSHLSKESYFVSCVRNKNRGLESSWCLIISKTDGEIINFVDAHDEG